MDISFTEHIISLLCKKNALMSTTENQPKKRDGVYIFIILLLIAGLAALGFLVVNKNKAIENCGLEKSELEADMAGMEAMMADYVDTEKGDIKSELKNMLAMYEEALSKNDSKADSIRIQQDKIKELLEELETNKKRSAREIYKLKKETETLRAIMKDYVRQIDSLFTVNTGLRNELTDKTSQLSNVTSQRDELQQKASTLETKVAAGARLSAYGISSAGMKYKLDGTLKENNRAGKIDKIRSCFTIGENSLAKSGPKYIYMQVITPDGKVLHTRSSNVIQVDGVNTMYSDRKEIDYQNQSIDVCIFYDCGNEELAKGNYIVRLYADGALIGKDSFTLK
jgi:hypothetical protein